MPRRRLKRREKRFFVVLSAMNSLPKGRALASVLVKERRAACVNIIPGVRSIYVWKNRFCEDQECLLMIKTSKAQLHRLVARIERLHPYEIPEIIALPIDAGAKKYFRWIEENTGLGG